VAFGLGAERFESVREVMAAYVDGLREVQSMAISGCFGRRAKKVCYLMADTDAELEDMREDLGLRRSWKHIDHYDLTSTKRRQAIQLGALSVTVRELVALRQKKRRRRRWKHVDKS